MERIQKGKEEFDRISIAVCDDDEEFIEQLESAAEQTLDAAGSTADIYKFKDGASLLSCIKNVELIFLDIEMPGINGFQAAREIMEKDIDVEIVFVTGHTQFVFDSFEYRPFDFVAKENLGERLDIVLNRYLAEYKKRKETIIGWKEELGERKAEYLLLNDILYMESQGHKLLLKTREGNVYRTRMTMNEAEESLGKFGFIRIHHGYLVNGYCIRRFGADECILDEGSRIIVSRGKKGKALEAYKRLRRE